MLYLINVSIIKPISNVEGSEEVIEALAPHILSVEDDDTEQVSDQAKNTRN